jgi:hypothetical protein
MEMRQKIDSLCSTTIIWDGKKYYLKFSYVQIGSDRYRYLFKNIYDSQA